MTSLIKNPDVALNNAKRHLRQMFSYQTKSSFNFCVSCWFAEVEGTVVLKIDFLHIASAALGLL
jgi:hypothetical protein